MYHETYHPLEGANLKDILDGMSEEEKRIAVQQVAAATQGKIRKYRVDIAEEMWFDVDNGIVKGSSNLGRK
jgi:hypothetical protein